MGRRSGFVWATRPCCWQHHKPGYWTVAPRILTHSHAVTACMPQRPHIVSCVVFAWESTGIEKGLIAGSGHWELFLATAGG